MKKLQKEFEFRGDIFTRVQKTKKAYMYERLDPETETKYYEVFPQVSLLCMNNETFTKKPKYKDVYPSDKDFEEGRAWCFTSEEKAIEKLNSIT